MYTVNVVRYYALFGVLWCSVMCRYMLLTAVHCGCYNVCCRTAESLLDVRRVYVGNQWRKGGGGVVERKELVKNRQSFIFRRHY